MLYRYQSNVKYVMTRIFSEKHLHYFSRPEDSFRWWSNPIRSIKHILVPNLQRVILIIVVLSVLSFIGNLTIKKLVQLFAKKSIGL